MLSGQSRSWSVNGGMAGIAWPTFSSGDNSAPEKPFINIKSYNAINGVQIIKST